MSAPAPSAMPGIHHDEPRLAQVCAYDLARDGCAHARGSRRAAHAHHPLLCGYVGGSQLSDTGVSGRGLVGHRTGTVSRTMGGAVRGMTFRQ